MPSHTPQEPDATDADLRDPDVPPSRPRRSRPLLTEGSVPKALIGLAGPMLFGIVSIMAMNLADTWFVSRLGTIDLAAMSFTFPVIALIGSAIMGIGIGASSVLSRAIGANKHDTVRRVATDTLLLALSIVIPLSVLGLLTIDPLFTALGATEQSLPLVREYMSVWYIGVIFLVVPMMGMSAIRALGDTKTPAMVMTGAAIINLVLDPIFIFGWGPVPAMGIKGAAIATVFSRSTTLVFALWLLTYREHLLSWRWPGVKAVLRSWREVLAVGGPAAGTNIIVPISIGILTGMVASYGETAVAAYGAGSRLDAIAMIVPMALAASMGPFVGQNWGAGEKGRVGEGLRFAASLAIGWGFITLASVFFLKGWMATLFTKDPDVDHVLQTFLVIAPFGHGLIGTFMVASAAFNAVGQPMKSAALTLLRAPILLVAFAALGARLDGLTGIFIGIVAANVVTGIAAWWLSAPLRPTVPEPVPAPAPS